MAELALTRALDPRPEPMRPRPKEPPMSQAQLVAMAKRNLAHVKAGTVDQADGVYRVPAANYYDPERWRLEMNRIFKRLPLVLGFSSSSGPSTRRPRTSSGPSTVLPTRPRSRRWYFRRTSRSSTPS